MKNNGWRYCGCCSNPRVLLLDEPTANLDPRSEQKVETFVKELKEQQLLCIVWISHDPAQAQRIADFQATMDHGQLSEVHARD